MHQQEDQRTDRPEDDSAQHAEQQGAIRRDAKEDGESHSDQRDERDESEHPVKADCLKCACHWHARARNPPHARARHVRCRLQDSRYPSTTSQTVS